MTPRKRFSCKVCSQECEGFSRSYCSKKCSDLEAARRAKARRTSTQPPEKSCAECGQAFKPSGTSKTCSKTCSALLAKRHKSERNRLYHETVRKEGLVRTFTDWSVDKKKILAENAKKRRAADPERSRQINRASRIRNIDKNRARCSAWQKANPDKVALHRKSDYQKHEDRFRRNDLKRKMRARETGMDPKDIARAQELLTRHGNACAYCEGSVEGKRNRHIDHVIPISRGGSDTLDNIVVACAPCNRNKSDRMPLEWLNSTGRGEAFRVRFPEAYARLEAWSESQQTKPFAPSPWVSLKNAGVFFGRSERTMRREVLAGNLEHRRFGNGSNAKIYLHIEEIKVKSGRGATWDTESKTWVPENLRDPSCD